jgi:hypothetical protein
MRPLLIGLLILIPMNIFSQISGVVIDRSSGYPVRYANIRVENENIGTTSDIEGKFTIREDILNKTLIISAIGFITEHIVADRDILRIGLKTRVYEMNEIVVTAEKHKVEFVVDNYDKDSISAWHCCRVKQLSVPNISDTVPYRIKRRW